MDSICQNCQKNYAVSEQDKAFYQKINIQPPSFCPSCRAQQRLSFRNESSLYKRSCDLCKKNIISIYSSDKPFPVYCQECFWSDKWNTLNFGQDFDPSKPFFSQSGELMNKVPRLSIINKQSQNSDYCNYSFANKNCYLTFGSHYEEDCLYGQYSSQNKNCLDCFWLYGSELCYESVYSKNCYQSVYLYHSENCQNCLFSVDLKSCKHCLFCANLRHKEYYFANKPYAKEDYFKKLADFQLSTFKGFSKAKEFYSGEFRKRFPWRASYQINCENCSGNNLQNCKNLWQSFDCTKCEDCRYGFQMDETYSSMDMNNMGYDRSELCYQTVGCCGLFNCLVCDSCWHDHDLQYCQLCFNCQNCFGCIGLQRNEYCILNKQYNKDEYQKVTRQIINQLKTNNLYGQFFPSELSPFGYNETVASEHFPLTKEAVLAKGYKWQAPVETGHGPSLRTPEIPDSIETVSDTILKETLTCPACSKSYRLTAPELKFYRQLQIPVPKKCPACRQKDRLNLRHPNQLWSRNCQKCGQMTQTVYSPERPEMMYCEKCFLEAVR